MHLKNYIELSVPISSVLTDLAEKAWGLLSIAMLLISVSEQSVIFF